MTAATVDTEMPSGPVWLRPVPQAVIWHGQCLDVLRTAPAESMDCVVTDPPYGLSDTDPAHVVEAITHWATGDREFVPAGKGFMGHEWDRFVPPPAVWDECLRVLKPGGHLLCFAGTRTMDLMTLSIRMAGFDIRDSIAWLYGSGFPKSMDVAKQIDGLKLTGKAHSRQEAATPEGEQWQGWGTALKPAFEPVIVARKPLIGTVAANVLTHGTGALNIDGTRVATAEGEVNPSIARRQGAVNHLSDRPAAETEAEGRMASRQSPEAYRAERVGEALGRWPANVTLTHDEGCEQLGSVVEMVGGGAKASQTGQATVEFVSGYERGDGFVGKQIQSPVWACVAGCPVGELDRQSGSGVSRYFPSFRYQPKAGKAERPRTGDGIGHPTVKPLELMRWLVRLVCQPGGRVMEPFAGSGTTVEAALMEGMKVVAVEANAEYLPLIEARINRWKDTQP